MSNALGDPLSIARSLSPLVEREAASAEAAGTLPESLIDAFRESGLFALQIPRALGGFEADAETSLAVYEEVCRADGSAGWTLLANASTSAFATTYTSDEAVQAMFAAGMPTHAGQFSPRGRAIATDDGYTVSGHYSFGSGSAHADWVGGGALEMVDGEPRMLAPGRPAIRVFFVPRDHVEFAGNWDVLGLVGTGSYDYVVPEQYVDAGFTFDLIAGRPLRGGPIYRIGVLGLALIGHAGFALGIGRRAINEVTAIARIKQRMGAATRIGDRERFQFELGRFDAALRSARSFVFESFGDAQAQLDRGDDLAPADFVRLRQATTYATHVAVDVTRFAYSFAGTDPIRTPSALGRCFRDIHAASQHLVVDDVTLVLAGQSLVEG
ncbi:MAG TPA: acyl-CoA dehydrogenase family protein [Acidimicrobiales bacterium]|nr:acyl-CoA dehydrogenase family protein [Acidimicrobiales bacterium]